MEYLVTYAFNCSYIIYLNRNQKLCQSSQKIGPKRHYYDSRSGKCFEHGSKEPCSENMVFGPSDTNHVFGKCTCDPETDIKTPLVYHELTERCHAMFTQVKLNVLFIVL